MDILENVVPPSTKRVEKHTPPAVQAKLRMELLQRFAKYEQMSASQLQLCLEALDREWNTERVLEANAASLALTGTLLGAFVHRRWLLLPGAVAFFLLQHAIQGWCPPLTLIRHMGVRTPQEIAAERAVIQYMIGTFENGRDDLEKLYNRFKG